MLHKLGVLITMCVLLSCSGNLKRVPPSTTFDCSSYYAKQDSVAPSIIRTNNQNPKGVVIVSHGLNSRPKTMNEIAELLKTSGYNVLLVALRGHSESGWPGDLLADDWVNDIGKAHCVAQKEFPQQKMYGVAYSLGAVSTLAFIEKFPASAFDKLVLIAPPIQVRGKIKLASILSIFAFTGLSLPSLAPVDYRAHPSTSLRAYRALFENIKRAKKFGGGEHAPKMLIVLDREDELLDFDATKNWAKSRSSNVRFAEYARDFGSELPRHLMIDRKSCGEAGWERISALILNNLKD